MLASVQWVLVTMKNNMNVTTLFSKEYVFIPVTRRVKGYTKFVGKYVTGGRKRFRPHKV